MTSFEIGDEVKVTDEEWHRRWPGSHSEHFGWEGKICARKLSDYDDIPSVVEIEFKNGDRVWRYDNNNLELVNRWKFDIGDEVRVTDEEWHQEWGDRSPYFNLVGVVRARKRDAYGAKEFNVYHTDFGENRIRWRREGNLELTTRRVTVTPEAAVEEYKKKVARLAQTTYTNRNKCNSCRSEVWCEDGYHDVLRELEVYDLVFPPIPEPEQPGTIAKKRGHYVAYIRVYGAQGRQKWTTTDTTVAQGTMFYWNEIKDDVDVVWTPPTEE